MPPHTTTSTRCASPARRFSRLRPKRRTCSSSIRRGQASGAKPYTWSSAVARAGVAQSIAQQSGELAVFVNPDLVRPLHRLMRRDLEAMREGAGNLRRDVLHERAAARDVEDLDAAADREQRDIPFARELHQSDLELVASRFRRVQGR